MISSAIVSDRTKAPKTFFWGVLSCLFLAVLISILLFDSIKMLNTVNTKSDLNMNLSSRFLELKENQGGKEDKELFELLGEYSGVVDALHNPIFYLSEIENYKTNQIRFESLIYEINNKTIRAVVKTKNDQNVSQFLSNLESSDVFESVELIKKDRRRDGSFRYNFNINFL